ncbi:sigma-70 family RNA polymerase sigma factor [Thiothrix lacustris]|uniref:Sigma-70 family RNA polymerase sigma factor n=1 Tax=Thiothrix lacustris TaxID=525917 RepID=A0ABY9MV05_9GAMM|nr:sigma-70 family RNA polymerase sigma factor [Thiothrix lacustris]WML92343.1 sigma-70 family RNA polymerase sigma factor [Thiothrix lacustris]WMP19276.1 sigma-70 family RNA polymerase sigma factor [Thiothrix lacustris]
MEPHSLNELLIRSGQGDAKAFQHLYDAASPRLFAVCKRLLRDEALAEDVLQEGFIKVWHHAAQFSASKASAMTWMTTIVRNQALDKLRQVKSRPESSEDVEYETLEFASLEPEPDALHQWGEDAQRLWHCLETLKPEQRECILQAFYHGQTHDELARTLVKPLGTVKAWIRRGLEQLRGCLQ